MRSRRQRSIVHSKAQGRSQRSTRRTLAARVTFLCVLLGVFVGPAAAELSANLYVDKANPSCSDAGPGSQAQPFCTISRGAAVAVAGDVVQVAAGTYAERVNPPRSGTSSAPIVFNAAPGATVTVSGQENAFNISGRSWITINGFNITDTVSYGVKMSTSSFITFSNNRVSYSGSPVSGQAKAGIYLQSTTDSVLSGNTVDHNSSFGIYLVSSARNQIAGNLVFSNAQEYQRAATGIRLYASTDNTISSNVSHSNEDSGIESYTNSHNNLIVNNDVYGNGDHGIDVIQSTTNRVISNTVYDNVTAGINVEGGATGATIRNNISVDNGINSPRTHSNIRVDSSSTSGTTMNRDLVYLSSPDVMVIWASTAYTSLAAFRTATGQEAQGIQADPRFADASAGNFHLLFGSPAIDSADSGASGQLSTDLEGTARFDDPATADTGAGPRSYDDRGAYEFLGAIHHIVISPGSATITAGGQQAYTAEGFDAANASLGDVTASTTFTISPNGSCTGATCTATVVGTHTVTGTNSGKTSDAVLAVNAGPLHHLAVSPASATISTGGSQAYTAQGRDQYDNSLGDVTASTTFTISPNGSCTGATCTASVAGPHTVTGTSAGKTGTAALTVNPVVDHIVISPASATITAGGSRAYTAEGFDSANNSLGDVTASTTFTISPNGSCTGATCTATVAGPHTVTGTYSGKTSNASLTVNPGALDHLALSPASATINSGGSQAYTAQGRDQHDNSLGDVTASTTFTISPDGSCTGATCTATAVGAHTVTGTSAGKTGTAALTVTGGLDHIVISPASATIDRGGSQAYTAQGFDAANNSLGDVTASTTFTISPNGSCTGATCTATVGGPHTVTGTNSGKTASASLSVGYVGNPGFEINTTGWNTSGSGANITLTRVEGGHSGSWSARLTNTGTTTSTYASIQDSPNWVTTTSAGAYTGSIWVRADTPGVTFKLQFKEYSGATLVGSTSTTIVLGTSWQQVTITRTIQSPGSTLDFQAYVQSPPAGYSFYADDASIVLG